MRFSIFPRAVCRTKSKISGEIVVKEQFGKKKLYVQGTLQSGGIIRGIWEKPLVKIFNFQFSRPRLDSVEDGSIFNCLILGLGGGTVVRLIKSHWPEAKIVGIEIDPEIIKVGKKYFGLGEIKNLQIIQTDAFGWIANHYDDSYHRSKGLKMPFSRTADQMTSNAGCSKERCGFPGDGRKNSQPRITNLSNISDSGGLEKEQKGRGVFDLIIVDLYLGKKFPKEAESKKFIGGIKKLLSKEGIAILNRLRTRGEDLGGFEKKLKKHFSLVEKVKTHTNNFFLVRN